jgi:hypothetical protein
VGRRAPGRLHDARKRPARAQRLFGEKFPTHAGDQVQLVFAAPGGVEAPTAVASRITATLNEAKEVRARSRGSCADGLA